MARRPIAPVAALLSALALSGCGASADGALDTQANDPTPVCRVHQKQPPGGRYTAGAKADTGAVLQMLRYYTANGAKAFCDGKPSTGTDRRWTDLYTALGGRTTATKR
ncbi:hypothetical protein [Streptomyces sp. NPDC086182]|jgi:hypothetical protein|uniref:hypothetical protein n=1 Tax=Streptomyces sp. NPDC086182 TaxID=3155058 RepID=UPI003413B27C